MQLASSGGSAPFPWALAVLSSGALVAAAAWLVSGLPSGVVWSGLAEAACSEYCESSTRCGALVARAAVQQPLNAYSSVAYLFVGVLASRRPTRPTRWLFLASAVVLAVGSFLFHASVTRELQWLDMVGTYAIQVAVVVSGWVAAFHLRQRTAVAIAIPVDALLAIFKWHIDASIVLPTMVVAAAVPMVVLVRRRQVKALVAAGPLLVLIAAAVARQLDVSRYGCNPDSGVFQGHALWHLLTAASLGWTFCLFDARAATK